MAIIIIGNYYTYTVTFTH